MADNHLDELVATLEAGVADTNRMWAEGDLPAGSVLDQVAEDLTAVQYSPRFDDGTWTASGRAEWLEGNRAAAQACRGLGCRWTMHDLVVLARSEDEAVASYRIVHHWGDEDRAPAQALFLESWRRVADGRWLLARHHAEKV